MNPLSFLFFILFYASNPSYISRFCGGEGLAIGVAFSHPLVDGTAAIFFINRWAKLVRGEELDPNEVPFLDRTLLKFPEPSEPCVDLPEWKPVRFMPDNIAEQKTNILINN